MECGLRNEDDIKLNMYYGICDYSCLAVVVVTLFGLSIADNVVKQMLALNGELWAVGRAGARHAAAVSADMSQV